MIDTALKNTAAVAMGGDLNAIGSYCIVNELQASFSAQPNFKRVSSNLVIFWCQFVQALLNDMIPI